MAASYTCPVLPPDGIRLEEMHTVFGPFTVRIGGVDVHISPITDEASYEDLVFIDEDGEEFWRKKPYLALTHLMAHVEAETEATDWASFDRRAFDQPALVALEETLQQLRAVADWVEINTHLTSLKVEYSQANGEALPWKTPFYANFEAIGDVLGDRHWEDVAAAVKSRRRVALSDELLMEARRFLIQRNQRFALVSAAVACEVLLRQLIVGALTATGGMTHSQGEDYFQEVSNRHLTALLPCFYDLPEGLVDSVYEVFNQRNLILHGKQRRQPSRDQARAAMATAGALASITAKA